MKWSRSGAVTRPNFSVLTVVIQRCARARAIVHVLVRVYLFACACVCTRVYALPRYGRIISDLFPESHGVRFGVCQPRPRMITGWAPVRQVLHPSGTPFCFPVRV